MLDALYIAATGMHAEQTQLESISNNLANMNTTAYKSSAVSFDDLLYRPVVDNNGNPANHSLGMGSSVSSVVKNFTVGDLQATQRSLDIAIRGNGFLEVDLGNGETAYTRNGNLALDENGYLTTATGYKLSNLVQIPPDATGIEIMNDGTVNVRLNNQDETIEVGQIELSLFMNQTGLAPVGESLYLSTQESGDVIYSYAGEEGAGEVAQGFLEGSNVDLIAEMNNLVITQRAYQVNSQVIKAADEMLQINNSLRG